MGERHTTSSKRPRARKAARSRATPNVEGEDVRERVLSAAVQLIDKGGLASLSMREVARVAGVSHQAPYHYFADREAILAALAEHGFRRLADRLESVRDRSKSSPENFGRLARAYVDFALESPSLFRIMFRPDVVDPERFPTLRECGDRAFCVLPEIVTLLIRDGLSDESSVQDYVVMSWSLVHGLACLILDGPLNEAHRPQLLHTNVTRDELIDGALGSFRELLEARMREGQGRRARKR